MSDAEHGTEHEAVQSYETVVVVGGGCYGGYYVRQLQRASAAGAVRIERLLIIDRDARCAVAESLASSIIPAELVVREWSDFFEEYLDAAAESPGESAADAIVPSPLMPHLMGEWLVRRARARFGEAVATRPFEKVPTVPWERAGDDGTHYVSFATWMCPINCVEPRICPHTRGERTWSLPVHLARHGEDARSAGSPLETAVLHCRHRTYGVGMFDTREVIAADETIRAAGARGAAEVIIGTVSHCHGALTRLVIGSRRSSPSDSPVG
jgi:hypothetical protein